MGIVLLIVVLFICLGGLPQVGWQQSYGYLPSGIGGVIVLLLIILLLTGRL